MIEDDFYFPFASIELVSSLGSILFVRAPLSKFFTSMFFFLTIVDSIALCILSKALWILGLSNRNLPIPYPTADPNVTKASTMKKATTPLELFFIKISPARSEYILMRSSAKNCGFFSAIYVASGYWRPAARMLPVEVPAVISKRSFNAILPAWSLYYGTVYPLLVAYVKP